MDVVAHVAQYVAIALLVLLVLQAHLTTIAHLDVQLHAQIVDAIIVYAVQNAILSHANAALNAQVILVNVVRYANLIHANAAQCV
jgi:hypothetical protein